MIAAALLACAINVHPATMDTIVRVESGGRPNSVHINHLAGPQPTPRTPEEAAATIRRYLAIGYDSIDIGLSQLNSRNLARLGYTIEDALEPCKNLAGGGITLSEFYSDAVRIFGEGQTALKAALSAYNTGNFYQGANYVARCYSVPAIKLFPTGKAVTVAINRHASDTEVW